MSEPVDSLSLWLSVAFAIGASSACFGVALLTHRRDARAYLGPPPMTSWVGIALSAVALALNFAWGSFVSIAGQPDAHAATVQANNQWLLLALTMFLLAAVGETLWRAREERTAVSLRERLEQARGEVRHLATHDPLTGLYNRLSLNEYVGALCATARQSSERFALLHIALDRFRVVNASMGHDVGDEALRLCAQRIQSVLRPTDCVARIGGDEFAVVLPGVTEPDRIGQVAGRVLAVVGGEAKVGEAQLHLSASIGASVYGDAGCSASELLSNAATAATNVKRSGRGGFRLYAESMTDYSRQRLELEADLLHALSRREFELHYQPMIALDSGRVTGMEALLRWRHPARGLVPPNDFIGLAEENGLIVPIGEWVLREACRQVREWNDEGLPLLRVSVNMSAVQFRRSDIVATVAAALGDTGLPASQLTIEVTESTVMTQAEDAVATLEELSRMGVSLAIDDFGTGYSSLSYLRRFPIDTLKVDRSFILDATRSIDAASIVRAVVSLAHGLRLDVVAEGVEDSEQRDFLKMLGCKSAQGYLFSRPVPPAKFREIVLEAQRRLNEATCADARQKALQVPGSAPAAAAPAVQKFTPVATSGNATQTAATVALPVE